MSVRIISISNPRNRIRWREGWIGTHALVTAKTFFFKYKDILGKTGRVLTRQIAKSKLLSL